MLAYIPRQCNKTLIKHKYLAFMCYINLCLSLFVLQSTFKFKAFVVFTIS